jgi:hypothetical protein
MAKRQTRSVAASAFGFTADEVAGVLQNIRELSASVPDTINKRAGGVLDPRAIRVIKMAASCRARC